MYRPKRIIDSHVHLITAGTNRAKLESLSDLDGELVKAYQERWEKSLASRNEERPEPSPPEVATVAARWVKALDEAGIEKAVFFMSTECHDELSRFLSFNRERFLGYTTFHPADGRSVALLKQQIEEDGIKGVKLYPMKRRFHVNDPACFGVYEVCQQRGIPVLIHFGLSISATHDLSYGNPLDLAGPALRFPGLKWIVPHFGTGFFKELLLLAAQYGNVYVDTSSSNNWVRHSPYPLTLRDLFQRTYETVGSKRILFGTDSSFFPRGYRRNILDGQLAVLNELGLTEDEIDDIFCRNIAGILRLDD